MSTPGCKDDPARLLARIIDSSQPRSVLCCGDLAGAVAAHWHEHTPQTQLVRLDPDKPLDHLAEVATNDLALISDTLEGQGQHDGEQLLGMLRNYGTQRIAVLVGVVPQWGFNDFIALGFRRHAELDTEAGPMTLYTYNLETYNHRRDWNNPRHWANPEMWGRARW